MSSIVMKVFQLNQQFLMSIGYSMDFIISQPELSIKPSKSILVFRPVSIEVFRSVEAFLENYPAPSLRGLVAEDLERLLVIRIDEVSAILSEVLLKEIYTVLS